MLAEKALREKARLNPEPPLLWKSGQQLSNTAPLDLKKLMADHDHIGKNLRASRALALPIGPISMANWY